jgi:hypothetical protein
MFGPKSLLISKEGWQVPLIHNDDVFDLAQLHWYVEFYPLHFLSKKSVVSGSVVARSLRLNSKFSKDSESNPIHLNK